MLDATSSPRADALNPGAANKSYRCYFTDGNDRIRSYAQVECEDDAQAAIEAQALLAASQLASAELWQGKRLVGKWDDAGAPRPRSQTNGDNNT